MSFEQWNMLIQTITMVGSMVLQVAAALFAYLQFKKMKQDRIARVMKEIDERAFKTYRELHHPDYDRIMATIEEALNEEIG